MDEETPEIASIPKPPPDSLCKECQTITGEQLLKTRPYHWGMDYMQYNEAGELEVTEHTPSVPGVYHTLHLSNPAETVKTCAACRLFNHVAYKGITLSGPTTVRLCLLEGKKQLEVEDMVKVEKKKEREEKMIEMANSHGRGRVSIFADYDSLAAQKFPCRTISPSGSDDSIACMQTWLTECDLNHPTCKLGLVGDPIAPETQMPTRVIDIGSFDGQLPPRLLETNGLLGKYIAVSHSWGRVVKPYTTTENISRSRHSIDVATLPKTFQDSIFIARKLHIQYVWIDSICIIQDDAEDWAHEAKTMGLVYEKACLVISASDSPGDHAGFLTPNPQVELEVRLPFQQNIDGGYVYLRGLYTGVITPHHTAISQRGWVLQERVLSRRILHFNNDQVHWECSQYRISEGGVKEDVTTNVNTSYYLGQYIAPLRVSSTTSNNEDERHEALITLYHFYACKIHEFSMCMLSYATDKIPAILGLGEEISRGTGIKFIAGHLLFEEPLFLYSLLWHSDIFSIEGSAMPEKRRAPSWSWAAMEGPRVFHLLGQDIALKFHRRIFLTIKDIREEDHALLCTGKVIPCKKGESFPGRYSSSLSGWDRMEVHRDTEVFKPPTFAHRLLDPSPPPPPSSTLSGIENYEVGVRWPRQENAQGWVCFDSKELWQDDVFFVPVCAPLEGEEWEHPETTRGCMGLVVVGIDTDSNSGQDEGSSRSTRTVARYKRVGFGGLYGTSWIGEKEDVEFLLL